ncbi:FMN reductase (NADPH) [Paenibacillus sp. J31TS4]|uniref:NADPH-dependent FMN reductase n=1 Tax=Paenibacillus sp. J31TS4 TaxID=2807195 RepID=UPI001B23DFF8|nr:NADPH-dependent FMN reductase [Paenibacillus sp. J31TS4]GIP38973.1 FMN reductase (NADPH) [Paenibacillus sp. J31TS4]
MANIVIISGSPSPTSRLTGVLAIVAEELKEQGAVVQTIDVRELPPEDLVYTKFDSPAIKEANRLIAEADGVVVATPVYKASYTGVLKAFLDLVPQKGLEGKVALSLAIGGSFAHLLVLDYAMKPVLAALGAQHQLQGVYTVDSQVNRLDDGRFDVEEGVAARLRLSAQELVKAATKL